VQKWILSNQGKASDEEHRRGGKKKIIDSFSQETQSFGQNDIK
jgi:hypothetical protein